MDTGRTNNSKKNFDAKNITSKNNSVVDLSRYYEAINHKTLQKMSELSTLQSSLNKALFTKAISPSDVLNSGMIKQMSKFSTTFSSVAKQINTVSNVQTAYRNAFSEIWKYLPNRSTTKNVYTDLIHPENSIFKNINYNAIKQLSTVRANIAKQLQENTKIISNTILQANLSDHLYIEEDKFFEKLIYLGWTWGPCFEDVDILDLFNKSEQEINDSMLYYYQKDNYSNLFDEMTETVSYLNRIGQHGFAKQYTTIMELLRYDFHNFTAIVPTLFSTLSFIFDYQHNLLNLRKFAAYKSTKDFKEENSHKVRGITFQTMQATAAICSKYYDNANFEFGPKKVQFGRNSVQHGRFDPERYREEDIIKLIVLIAAMEEFDIDL